MQFCIPGFLYIVCSLFRNNNRQGAHRSGTGGIIRRTFIGDQRLTADLSDHPGIEIIGMVHIVAADIGEALAPQQRIRCV